MHVEVNQLFGKETTEKTTVFTLNLMSDTPKKSFEANNRGQSSCRCTLDQWLDLIGVITSQIKSTLYRLLLKIFSYSKEARWKER